MTFPVTSRSPATSCTPVGPDQAGPWLLTVDGGINWRRGLGPESARGLVMSVYQKGHLNSEDMSGEDSDMGHMAGDLPGAITEAAHREGIEPAAGTASPLLRSATMASLRTSVAGTTSSRPRTPSADRLVPPPPNSNRQRQCWSRESPGLPPRQRVKALRSKYRSKPSRLQRSIFLRPCTPPSVQGRRGPALPHSV